MYVVELPTRKRPSCEVLLLLWYLNVGYVALSAAVWNVHEVITQNRPDFHSSQPYRDDGCRKARENHLLTRARRVGSCVQKQFAFQVGTPRLS